jgi:branched-chain amino acid transport system substrate-binding protein
MKLSRISVLVGSAILAFTACTPGAQTSPSGAASASAGASGSASADASSAAPSGSGDASPSGSAAAAECPVDGPVGIWSSLPRQGSSKGQTDTIVNAMNLALEERGGMAGGCEIEYTDGDDSTAEAGQWTEAKEIENATNASTDESVVAYLGTFNSGAAQVSIPINCQSGLVMISPANTYPGLTKPGKGAEGEPDKFYPGGCTKNYTRVVPADDLQGLAGAKWAAQLELTKVYVIDDSQLYGKGIADVFRAEGPGLGLEIAGSDSILGTETDYKSLAQAVAAAAPDLVYFGGITQLWRDIDEALPEVAMMGPDGIFEEAFLEAAGAAAEGTYVTFGGLPASELEGVGAEFVAKYQAEFGGQLEAYTAYGYEAMNVALDAIDAATDATDFAALRAAVLENVKATKDYTGVLGTWSFDENGDTTLTAMSGQQVTDGAFAFSTVIE